MWNSNHYQSFWSTVKVGQKNWRTLKSLPDYFNSNNQNDQVRSCHKYLPNRNLFSFAFMKTLLPTLVNRLVASMVARSVNTWLKHVTIPKTSCMNHLVKSEMNHIVYKWWTYLRAPVAGVSSVLNSATLTPRLAIIGAYIAAGYTTDDVPIWCGKNV